MQIYEKIHARIGRRLLDASPLANPENRAAPRVLHCGTKAKSNNQNRDGLSTHSTHFLAISRELNPGPLGRPQRHRQVTGTQKNPPAAGISALVRTF
jgi:hypothetical protein